MSEVTRLLEAAATGDRQAAADMLPFGYDELRKLAAARLADESTEHPLRPTNRVHNASLRLVGRTYVTRWENRGHFFAAALTRLAGEDPQAVRLVGFRHFAGLTVPEGAGVLGNTPRTAARVWAFPRAWHDRTLNADNNRPES
jgi:hypothetical protein